MAHNLNRPSEIGSFFVMSASTSSSELHLEHELLFLAISFCSGIFSVFLAMFLLQQDIAMSCNYIMISENNRTNKS